MLDIVVSNLNGPSINNVNITSKTCTSGNGALSFDITTAGTYNLAWIGPSAGLLPNVSGTVNLNSLSAGTYQFELTDNTTGCVHFFEQNIERIGGITMMHSVLQNPACAGGTDSVLQVMATSGSLPFQYYLNGAFVTGTFSNSFNFMCLTLVPEVRIVDGNFVKLLIASLLMKLVQLL